MCGGVYLPSQRLGDGGGRISVSVRPASMHSRECSPQFPLASRAWCWEGSKLFSFFFFNTFLSHKGGLFTHQEDKGRGCRQQISWVGLVGLWVSEPPTSLPSAHTANCPLIPTPHSILLERMALHSSGLQRILAQESLASPKRKRKLKS